MICAKRLLSPLSVRLFKLIMVFVGLKWFLGVKWNATKKKQPIQTSSLEWMLMCLWVMTKADFILSQFLNRLFNFSFGSFGSFNIGITFQCNFWISGIYGSLHWQIETMNTPVKRPLLKHFVGQCSSRRKEANNNGNFRQFAKFLHLKHIRNVWLVSGAQTHATRIQTHHLQNTTNKTILYICHVLHFKDVWL